MNASAKALEQRYRDSLARLQPPLSGSDQYWLQQHRREAAESLARLGLPQRRQEAWRYSNVERLLEHEFVPAAATEARLQELGTDAFLLPQPDAWRAVFVNGRFATQLSSLDGLPPGVTAGSLRQSIERNPILAARWLGTAAGAPAHAFSALNATAFHDGLLVHLPQGVQLTRPIEVLYLTTSPAGDAAAQPRGLVLLEAGARATLVERFASPGQSQYFNNGLSEIILLDGAELEHFRLQQESPAAFHLHSLFVQQHADSGYRNTGFQLGGAWSRSEIRIDFHGSGARADLDGIYLSGDRQLADVHLDIRHAQPGCSSRTEYRGLLHGKGRAVFDGRIEVGRDARKSEAHLHNANLLLSRSAEVDTKPQLEIHADEVKCSHGASVGQLDPDQLFYLRTRGIDAQEARRMLCLGFVGELLERCRIAQLREAVAAAVNARLAQSPASSAPEAA